MTFPKGFFLLYDSDNREDETDLCLPVELVTPKHIMMMRKYAGGLVCLAINEHDANNLGITFMTDILKKFDCGANIYEKTKYGDHPAFSISINHKTCRTGISDIERAITSKKLYQICKNKKYFYFKKEFFAPGHLQLLISRNIKIRQGHTELSILYAKLNGYYPMTIICEMLDDNGKRLNKKKAMTFATKNKLPFVEAKDILKQAIL